MKFTLQKGFTLIETIVVLAIMGVLAAIVLRTVDPITQLKKADDARRKSDINQIQKALETYYNDNNQYPDPASWQSALTSGNYLPKVPVDPNATKSYTYVRPVGVTQQFRLYAALDVATDRQSCGTPTTTNCPNIGSTSCGSGVACNYGVSSTNTRP